MSVLLVCIVVVTVFAFLILRARSAGEEPMDASFQAVNLTRDRVLAERVEWAGTDAQRRRGLLGRTGLDPGQGLYLVPCQWVHMIGMRFPIDVAFLDDEGHVLSTCRELRPYRISKPVWKAEGALELPARALESSGTRVGDVVRLERVGKESS